MVRVGKIVATHGIQGAVILKHIVERSGWLKKDIPLFIELLKGSYIPYFTIQAKDSNDEEIIIHLEDVASAEAAKKLVGKHVYVNADVLGDKAEDSPLLWIGFNIVDKQKGSLGTIEDVYQAGAQWLAKITINDSEVLIPLVKEFLIQVNTRNKFIRTDLPEGLIDIYLEK
jgi:16S rRNA processing protein RimM